MKKVLLPVFAGAIIVLSSCEEKGPVINFGGSAVSDDTTYVSATVETPQARNIVVEEFTGAMCANCPKARDLLTGIVNQNAGRVFPVEIHIFNFAQSNPATAHGGVYDFRTQDGTDIGTQFYVNVNQMPAAGINRFGGNEDRLLLSGKWANLISQQLAATTPVNVSLESTFDDATREATIKVNVAYTQEVAKQQFLSIAVIEDDIYDVQEYPDSFAHHYKFKHTLRDFITPITGEAILNDVPTKEKGRVYQRTIKYKVSDAWKAPDCKVIAFVHYNDADSKEILQSAEVKLK